MQLQGKKILVTGPAGQIAFPLAARLAKDNEVWGIARFSDAEGRERCEKAGIQTRVVDLADPDWADLPDDFDALLHLAAAIVPGHDYDTALRINAEGTGRVMSRFRNAKACLMMSTCPLGPRPFAFEHHLYSPRLNQVERISLIPLKEDGCTGTKGSFFQFAKDLGDVLARQSREQRNVSYDVR